MSIAALNWAWGQECPNATSKLVLLALADKANEDGECWPGMDTVAQMAGVSVRQISTHLSRLAEWGLIRRERRRQSLGRLGRYVFHLNMASGSELPVDQEKSTSGSAPQVEGDRQWKPDVATSGSPASSATGSPPQDKEHPSKGNPQGTFGAGKPRKQKRKPELPLPTDWQPNDQHRDLGRGLGVDVDTEAAQFRDHAEANDRRQRDWDAAFRTWLRNAAKWNRNREPAPSGEFVGGVRRVQS